jgi:hypothetical protein
MAVARLDVIVDAVDHRAVNQQAFLSTGDESFQADVVVSVETLELNIDMLNSLPAKYTSRRALPVELSRSIKQVIANLSESNRIRETDNRAAAVDFFASKGDDVSRAKWQAEQLRIAIIRSIAGRIWSTTDSIFWGYCDEKEVRRV